MTSLWWPRRYHRFLLAVVLATFVLAAACSDSTPSACAPAVDEEFDPQSSLHVAPGTEVEYLTWPPTSGPHLSSESPSGARAEALSGPLQVTVLEAGKVLIQYQDVSSGDVERLSDLAGENVVVAPGTDLPDAVVSTAWRKKQTCSAVDTGSLEEFIEIYALPEPAD